MTISNSSISASGSYNENLLTDTESGTVPLSTKICTIPPMENENSFCPCGLAQPYESCCGRFISAGEAPRTAEELMRSRYTAYARGDIGYIAKTTHPDKREKELESQIREWADQVHWNFLEVLSVANGRTSDKIGKVEFRAHYSHEGAHKTHHELSRFKRYKGAWHYYDGEIRA